MSEEEIRGPSSNAAGWRGSEIPFYSATSSSGWRSSALEILPFLVEPLPELPLLLFLGGGAPPAPSTPDPLYREEGREQGLLWLVQAMQRDPEVRRD